MKIDELNQQVAAAYLTTARADRQPESADTHSESAGRQPRTTDKVELSTYMPVAGRGRQPEEMRTAKVDEIKSQIANGTYEVSGQAVAEKMLSKIVLPESN